MSSPERATQAAAESPGWSEVAGARTKHSVKKSQAPSVHNNYTGNNSSGSGNSNGSAPVSHRNSTISGAKRPVSLHKIPVSSSSSSSSTTTSPVSNVKSVPSATGSNGSVSGKGNGSTSSVSATASGNGNGTQMTGLGPHPLGAAPGAARAPAPKSWAAAVLGKPAMAPAPAAGTATANPVGTAAPSAKAPVVAAAGAEGRHLAQPQPKRPGMPDGPHSYADAAFGSLRTQSAPPSLEEQQEQQKRMSAPKVSVIPRQLVAPAVAGSSSSASATTAAPNSISGAGSAAPLGTVSSALGPNNGPAIKLASQTTVDRDQLQQYPQQRAPSARAPGPDRSATHEPARPAILSTPRPAYDPNLGVANPMLFRANMSQFPVPMNQPYSAGFNVYMGPYGMPPYMPQSIPTGIDQSSARVTHPSSSTSVSSNPAGSTGGSSAGTSSSGGSSTGGGLLFKFDPMTKSVSTPVKSVEKPLEKPVEKPVEKETAVALQEAQKAPGVPKLAAPKSEATPVPTTALPSTSGGQIEQPRAVLTPTKPVNSSALQISAPTPKADGPLKIEPRPLAVTSKPAEKSALPSQKPTASPDVAAVPSAAASTALAFGLPKITAAPVSAVVKVPATLLRSNASKGITYADASIPGPHNNFTDRRYPRDFLLQFQDLSICNEFPIGLRFGDFFKQALHESETNKGRSSSARDQWQKAGRPSTHGPRRPKGGKRGVAAVSGPAAVRKNVTYASGGKAIAGTLIRGQVARLVVSDNAWRPPSKVKQAATVDSSAAAREAAVKSMRSLINKITDDNYERLKDKIQAIKVDDIETLDEVVSVLFDKAVVDSGFAPIYARLCFDIFNASALSPPNDVDSEGKTVSFRRRLLAVTQKEYSMKNQRIVEREEAAARQQEELGREFNDLEKMELFEDITRLKRRMLGTIIFVGELFKKRLLSSDVIAHCIAQILSDVAQEPKEDEVECLMKLLRSIGPAMENNPKFPDMPLYFKSVVDLSTNKALPSRLRFMLEDLIALREANWDEKRIQKTTMSKGKRGGRAGASVRGARTGPAVTSSQRATPAGSPAVEAGSSPQRSSSFGRGERTAALVKSGELSPSWQRGGPRGSPGAAMRGRGRGDERQLSARPAAPPVKSREELDELASELLEEYLDSLEVDEAVDCVRDLRKEAGGDTKSNTYMPFFVAFCINTALEKSSKEVKLVASLLALLVRKDLLTSTEVAQGITDVMQDIPDLKVDVPKAPQYLADVVAHLLTAKPRQVVTRTLIPAARPQRGRGKAPSRPAEPTYDEQTTLAPLLTIDEVAKSVSEYQEFTMPGKEPPKAPFSAELLSSIARRKGFSGLRSWAEKGGVVSFKQPHSDLPLPRPKTVADLAALLRIPLDDSTWFKANGLTLAFPVESGFKSELQKTVDSAGESIVSILDWIDENVPEHLIRDAAFLRVLVRCGLEQCMAPIAPNGEYSQHLAKPEAFLPWLRLIKELDLVVEVGEDDMLDEVLQVCTEVVQTNAGTRNLADALKASVDESPDQDLLLMSEVLKMLLSADVALATPAGSVRWWPEAKEAESIERWTHVDALTKRLEEDVPLADDGKAAADDAGDSDDVSSRA